MEEYRKKIEELMPIVDQCNSYKDSLMKFSIEIQGREPALAIELLGPDKPVLQSMLTHAMIEAGMKPTYKAKRRSVSAPVSKRTVEFSGTKRRF